jgi:hypothetical protein
MEFLYPPRLAQRVLAVEAPGGPPDRVTLTLPSVASPDELIELKIAVLDERGYPSTEYDGALELSLPWGETRSLSVPFRAGEPAVASVAGLSAGPAGFVRASARLRDRTFHSNPMHCAQQPALRLYWGDPHVHTNLSNCHPDSCRSLNFCFVAARYASGLDWVAAADHVSNGRSEFAKWQEQTAVANAHDDPPAFVSLPGYEASLKGGAGGDNNMYMARFPQMFVDAYEEGSVQTLVEEMAGMLPRDEFFVVPHHTTRTGKHGEIGDDIYPGADMMPVIEIHSKWGTSEYRGNPNALHKIHPGPSYAADLLNRGLQLGFIAGTDTHATMPSAFGDEPGHIDRLPGLTAVWAPTLTRESIFRGIQHRACYGTSLERIYLAGELAGIPFGESRTWNDARRPREVTVTAAGQSDILRIELVRNGGTIRAIEPHSWHGTWSLVDDESLAEHWLESRYLGRFAYYYVRVTCASGAQAWSSPAWLLA